ncbi:flagellar hook-basal body complex protein FliE [Tersicoccus solisilvae]|uniref:flagellar hook-basal body complex protein FliE n=1 Tax=Tersicoccus solisilvae TaxID=1882339 RepID=UPI00166D7727|nr:flagellar hook-basal body complex protein FliE [Tersicoccus solisilvae]
MSELALGAVSGVTGTGYVGRAAGAGDSAFAGTLAGVLGDLQAQQTTSNTLAVQAVTGDLTDIHRATLAASRAQTTMELVATVRNQAISGFNEMMRMQA